jgi:hypothetical protein
VDELPSEFGFALGGFIGQYHAQHAQRQGLWTLRDPELIIHGGRAPGNMVDRLAVNAGLLHISQRLGPGLQLFGEIAQEQQGEGHPHMQIVKEILHRRVDAAGLRHLGIDLLRRAVGREVLTVVKDDLTVTVTLLDLKAEPVRPAHGDCAVLAEFDHLAGVLQHIEMALHLDTKLRRGRQESGHVLQQGFRRGGLCSRCDDHRYRRGRSRRFLRARTRAPYQQGQARQTESAVDRQHSESVIHGCALCSPFCF